MQGTDFDQYFGEHGRGSEVPPYNYTAILTSPTNLVINQLQSSPLTEQRINITRTLVDRAACSFNTNITNYQDCHEPCLFDLLEDPCEIQNIAQEQPQITKQLLERIQQFVEELVPQTNKPSDRAANPIYYNNTWCTWLDVGSCPRSA